MKPLILGRDGVINKPGNPIVDSPEAFEPLPGSLAALADLTRAGYELVVVTNQPGISAGHFTINRLNRIHERMIQLLREQGGEIGAIFFCPHEADAGCDCRKPAPGLMLEAGRRLQCPLDGVYAIGDTVNDLQAAHAAGARPVLVRTGRGRDTQAKLKAGEAKHLRKVPVYDDLAAFVARLLET